MGTEERHVSDYLILSSKFSNYDLIIRDIYKDKIPTLFESTNAFLKTDFVSISDAQVG